MFMQKYFTGLRLSSKVADYLDRGGVRFSTAAKLGVVRTEVRKDFGSWRVSRCTTNRALLSIADVVIAVRKPRTQWATRMTKDFNIFDSLLLGARRCVS